MRIAGTHWQGSLAQLISARFNENSVSKTEGGKQLRKILSVNWVPWHVTSFRNRQVSVIITEDTEDEVILE